MIAVLAGSRDQYEDWLRSTHTPRDETRLVLTREDAQDGEFDRCITVGTWWALTYAGLIFHTLDTRIRDARKPGDHRPVAAYELWETPLDGEGARPGE